MFYFIQTPDGQRMLVSDLSGHEDCTVLASNVAEPPEWVTVADLADDGTVTLAALKNNAWEQVKAIRAAKETGTCPTPVGVVQIDEKSKAKIMGALDLCKLQEETQRPFAMNFTLADNTRVVLNNTTVRQMAGAAGQYVGAVYDHSWALRDAINSAADATALNDIDLNAGWP